MSTTSECGLHGAADLAHLEHGRVDSRVVVTFDRDFAALLANATGRPHRGIVDRPAKSRLSIGEVTRGLRAIWEVMAPEDVEDELIYLTSDLLPLL